MEDIKNNPKREALHEAIKILCESSGVSLIAFITDRDENGSGSLLIYGADKFPAIIDFFPDAVFKHQALSDALHNYAAHRAAEEVAEVVRCINEAAEKFRAEKSTKH